MATTHDRGGERKDHYCCFQQSKPPCGIKGLHRCCLCGKAVPTEPKSSPEPETELIGDASPVQADKLNQASPEPERCEHGVPGWSYCSGCGGDITREVAVRWICGYRKGGMDRDQFKANVDHLIGLVESRARREERENRPLTKEEYRHVAQTVLRDMMSKMRDWHGTGMAMIEDYERITSLGE